MAGPIEAPPAARCYLCLRDKGVTRTGHGVPVCARCRIELAGDSALMPKAVAA